MVYDCAAIDAASCETPAARSNLLTMSSMSGGDPSQPDVGNPDPGWNRMFGRLGRIIGRWTSSFTSLANHGWRGQNGAMSRILQFSCSILANTCEINDIGGKAYARMPSHRIDNASMCHALGSGPQAQ